mmetsp:Transcript_20265/g.58158  ORF Transcript_20265/g.58158 Transcript_20265/m.58158 type:complete len:236 (-) Transcript_20265:692-1399(-)
MDISGTNDDGWYFARAFHFIIDTGFTAFINNCINLLLFLINLLPARRGNDHSPTVKMNEASTETTQRLPKRYGHIRRQIMPPSRKCRMTPLRQDKDHVRRGRIGHLVHLSRQKNRLSGHHSSLHRYFDGFSLSASTGRSRRMCHSDLSGHAVVEVLQVNFHLKSLIYVARLEWIEVRTSPAAGTAEITAEHLLRICRTEHTARSKASKGTGVRVAARLHTRISESIVYSTLGLVR